jgi:trimethylamine--corrinoid protein Co-methyltransferase
MRAGRRTRRDKAGEGLHQLPWSNLRNFWPPLELLEPDQLEDLHATSIRILKELGIKVMCPQTRARFVSAGARVDHEGIVYIDETLVCEALRTAPSSVTLTPRNPERAVTLGGKSLVFGLVAGPPNVHDKINGRRSGNLEDYQNFVRLAQYFNAIHMIGNQVAAPQELPANNRHLDCYLANLSLSDLTYHCTAIGRGRAMDGIRMMAISRGITLDQMVLSPGVTTIISVNSPRLLDEAMAEGLTAMAEHGQPVTITPFTLMGAMTPVSLPAALAQQNAEALFGVVLTQLVRPGAPAIYGAFTSNVDMRSGAPAFGTPENAKANIIAGQLARRYGLPYRTSNANASNAVDLQAAYETSMATWGAVLGGANLVYHAAGWLEGGLTASYEKLILDVEILQNMIEVLRPLRWDTEELGFEAIRDVPAGGHFFASDHTMARYEKAFYRPMLSDWRAYDGWVAAGASEAIDRATVLWQQALADYNEPPMDAAIREELEDYVARRRKEIGDDEP